MVLEALDITHHFTSSEKCYYMKKWSLEEGKDPSEGRFSTNTNNNNNNNNNNDNNNNNNNECNVISGKVKTSIIRIGGYDSISTQGMV